MTILIITIVVAWLVFSTLLVVIICVNSARLSRMDELFEDLLLLQKREGRKGKE